MKRTAQKTWLAYAGAGLVVTAVAVLVAQLLAPAPTAKAITVGAVIAYVVQLGAFGMLVVGGNSQFLTGWLIGMVLRFGTLGAAAFWVTRTTVLPAQAFLLSLVGFVFVLLMLEPVFLRWDLRKS